MIDRQMFNDMFNNLDKENIVELIDIFFSQYEERFEAIRKNVTERDFDHLKETSHKLKGALVLFMDPVTSQLSKRFVEMARSNTEAGLDQMLADLEKNTRILVEELKVIRKELSS